jgi:hypothetical protein
VNLFDATNEYYLNNHLALAAPAATIHARALQKKVIGSDNYEEFTLAMNMNALTVHVVGKEEDILKVMHDF